VLEDGGDEDQAIAALLHDAVEDQGGLPTLERIRNEFGERVAGIVEACSDSTLLFKPPWKFRKEEYLHKLPSQPAEVLLVSLADKVHNARTILVALQRRGDGIWERFNGGKEGTLWYYHELTQVYEGLVDPIRLGELKRLVGEIEKIAGSAGE
jgi:(p)ppGpp synthase/HD superfamily hydrolase